MQAQLEWHGVTIQGRRENNQDGYLAVRLGENVSIFAVADGMGGTYGGSIASKLALDEVQKVVADHLLEGPLKLECLKEVVSKIFQRAQKAIKERKEQSPNYSGMGTTLACVVAVGEAFVVGNVGDSRVYHLSSSGTRQMTEDHTYIRDLQTEKSGELDPELRKKYSSVLTRTLDGEGDEPDLFPVDGQYACLQNGDALILCSDGLILDKTEDVSALFHRYVIGTKDLRRSAEQLSSWAFYNGSTDNITVLIASYGKLERDNLKLKKYRFPPHLPSPAARGVEQKSKRSKRGYFALGVFILCLVVMAVFFLPARLGYWSDQNGSVKEPKGERIDTIALEKKKDEATDQAKAAPSKHVEWSAFLPRALPYSLNESFPWIEYPEANKLKSYTITIGSFSVTTSEVGVALAEFRQRGLKPRKEKYPIKIQANLKDGTTVTQTSTITISN